MAPFRFGLQASQATSVDQWRTLARTIEDLGYSTLWVPDHLDEQWAPMIALSIAAEATTTLRLGTLVLDNDFRHPVILAKEAATMDVVTAGRFEFGLGAGWLRTDYEQSGIAMEPASVRIAKLAESLEIMRRLWRDGSATFDGTYYSVSGVTASPAPITPGGPPLVIGGGSRRILTLAGQFADTVSIVPSLAAGAIGKEVAAQSVADKYTERVGWATAAARPAGRPDRVAMLDGRGACQRQCSRDRNGDRCPGTTLRTGPRRAAHRADRTRWHNRGNHRDPPRAPRDIWVSPTSWSMKVSSSQWRR